MKKKLNVNVNVLWSIFIFLTFFSFFSCSKMVTHEEKNVYVPFLPQFAYLETKAKVKAKSHIKDGDRTPASDERFRIFGRSFVTNKKYNDFINDLKKKNKTEMIEGIHDFITVIGAEIVNSVNNNQQNPRALSDINNLFENYQLFILTPFQKLVDRNKSRRHFIRFINGLEKNLNLIGFKKVWRKYTSRIFSRQTLKTGTKIAAGLLAGYLLYKGGKAAYNYYEGDSKSSRKKDRKNRKNRENRKFQQEKPEDDTSDTDYVEEITDETLDYFTYSDRKKVLLTKYQGHEIPFLWGGQLSPLWFVESVGADLSWNVFEQIKNEVFLYRETLNIGVIDLEFLPEFKCSSDGSRDKCEVDFSKKEIKRVGSHGNLVASLLVKDRPLGGTLHANLSQIGIPDDNVFFKNFDLKKLSVINGSIGVSSVDIETGDDLTDFISQVAFEVYFRLVQSKSLIDDFKRWEKEVNKFTDDGGIFVLAAGNDYPKKLSISFRPKNAITIASIGPWGMMSSFSSKVNKNVTVAAPGELIYSELPQGLKLWNGTSAASPFAAAVISNVKYFLPFLNVDQIKILLTRTALKSTHRYLSRKEKEYSGSGTINPYKLAKVVQRILTVRKKDCYSADKINRCLYDNALYDFNDEAKNDLRVAEKIMSTKDLSQKKFVFDLLRSSFLLNENSTARDKLAAIYYDMGLDLNALFLDIMSGQETEEILFDLLDLKINPKSIQLNFRLVKAVLRYMNDESPKSRTKTLYLKLGDKLSEIFVALMKNSQFSHLRTLKLAENMTYAQAILRIVVKEFKSFMGKTNGKEGACHGISKVFYQLVEREQKTFDDDEKSMLKKDIEYILAHIVKDENNCLRKPTASRPQVAFL